MKPGARMVFTTVLVGRDLGEEDRRRAIRVGPSAVETRRDHGRLLEAAGFVDIDELDITEAYSRTARAWLEGCERLAGELATVYGEAEFQQTRVDRRATVEAIEAGLLRRSLFAARRPGA